MIVLGLFLGAISTSDACIIAAPPGASVTCLSEEALIVWDSISKQQELVRSINVQSHAADFGFLTATPSHPVVRPVEQDLFLRAYTLTKPRESQKIQTRFRWSWLFQPQPDGETTQEESASLSSGTIAGADNIVFAASESAAVESWFHENGYAYTRPLQKWVADTVEKNWFITAFRVERPKSATTDSRLRIRTIQMSFLSTQPIYPYREPTRLESLTGLGRLLRLYLISDEQLHGALEGDPWSAEMVYSGKRGDMQPQLGPFFVHREDVPGVGWFSLFTDKSPYRSKKDDLRFVPVHQPKQINRKPRVVEEIRWVMIPLDCIAVILFMLFAVLRWRKK